MSNIYQIKKAEHINEIFAAYSDKLVIVMYASNEITACRLFKPKFKKISQIYKDFIFLYIDVKDFTNGELSKYATFDNIPYFVIYYNSHPLANMIGAHEK